MRVPRIRPDRLGTPIVGFLAKIRAGSKNVPPNRSLGGPFAAKTRTTQALDFGPAMRDSLIDLFSGTPGAADPPRCTQVWPWRTVAKNTTTLRWSIKSQ